MKRVVILGAGGLAREVLWVFREVNKITPQWEVIGFIDEKPQKHGQMLCDLPVLGDFDWFATADTKDLKVICGIGDTEVRKRMVEKAKGLDLEFCSVIEPSVKMSDYVQNGEGVVICAGNIITTQVTIGNHVFINLANTIGHDVVIHDFVNLAPGNNVSGNVTFREGVRVGTGCAFIPGVTIGEWSTIGAASIVTKDIPPHSVAVGGPARVIRKRAGT